MNRLEGKVAVVVGAARGIGLATAREFLAEGATVYSCDIRDTAVDVQHPRYSHRIVDATNETEMQALVDSVLAAENRIDILFCNVGIHLGKEVTETSVDEFDHLLAVNMKSAFLACRAVLPSMLARRAGNIVITSSNGGIIGRPGDPVYNASKHALVGFAKSLAVAYADRGIRVNTVNPGIIDTDMARGTADELSAAVQKKLVATTPAARIGDPVEVAKTVVFLAGDEARFINGIALAIDGAKSAGVMRADRYSLDFHMSEIRSNGPVTVG